MISKIAVIGATGVLGAPVANELVRAGFNVTALVRNKTKAEKVLLRPVSLMAGDIRNLADLKALMAGQDALYMNLNLDPHEKKNDFHTETDGLRNILDVARSAGIKRIGFISSLVMRYQGMNHFNWWVFDVKREAVRLIHECGIPYSIFYPSTFMENFETNYRRGKSIMLTGTSHYPMYFISAVDYGKQVARSFQVLKNENREYVVQGPQAFTADEATKEYINHHTKERLSISKFSLGLLQFFGTFSRQMNYVSHIVEALNNYPEKFEAQDTWNELGTPTITLQQFASGKYHQASSSRD
jgi:uncharacterized protein YbjT (DUF2867 family)